MVRGVRLDVPGALLASRPAKPAFGRQGQTSGYRGGMLRAVLLDVDFTLFRPGPELGPEGYRRAGVRHGLALDPGRYEEARLAAVAGLERHPELEHDEEIWIAFTEGIVRGMGGDGPPARACALEIVREWERHGTSSSTTTHEQRSRHCVPMACA